VILRLVGMILSDKGTGVLTVGLFAVKLVAFLSQIREWMVTNFATITPKLLFGT
jgi:hypothetical protein